jgi:hypothetical protein
MNNFLNKENSPIIIKAQEYSSMSVSMKKKIEKEEDNKLTCKSHHSLK